MRGQGREGWRRASDEIHSRRPRHRMARLQGTCWRALPRGAARLRTCRRLPSSRPQRCVQRPRLDRSPNPQRRNRTMRIIESRRGYFLGTHKGHNIEIERDHDIEDCHFYIRVWNDFGHAYDGYSPAGITTIAEAKKEALRGACLV